MPLEVRMYEVTDWIESEQVKEEINQKLKKVTDHNLKKIEDNGNLENYEDIYTITKNAKVVFNFFMDENQEKKCESCRLLWKV